MLVIIVLLCCAVCCLHCVVLFYSFVRGFLFLPCSLCSLVSYVRSFCVREVCEVRFPGFVFAFALLCFELACFVGSFWVVLFRIVS